LKKCGPVEGSAKTEFHSALAVALSSMNDKDFEEWYERMVTQA
jgi:hypothetical protein